jgi:hypothetical protein
MYQIKSTHIMLYFLKTAKMHLLGKFYTTFIGVRVNSLGQIDTTTFSTVLDRPPDATEFAAAVITRQNEHSRKQCDHGERLPALSCTVVY